jgi:class 3 adenylate cyclase/pimeloyl-ACP methyl ester carboxylesterase
VTSPPETCYTRLEGDGIAYQVFGDGDVDLIYVPSLGDSMECRWELPSYIRFLDRLSASARVIMFDMRGSGVSDPPSGQTLPSWERWADEARIVLDAVNSTQAVVCGAADGSPTAILFAASHPARTRGLVLLNASARFAKAPDYPVGIPTDDQERLIQFIDQVWGTEAFAEATMPDAARDPAFRRWVAKSLRNSLGPRGASTYLNMARSLDVRQALPSVRVPTLVLHRESYELISAAHGRFVAEHIDGARFSLVPGRDLCFYAEPMDEALQLIEGFISGLSATEEPDRALAAILFTDIVGSTQRVSAVGDREWRLLIESHDAIARAVVEQHRGQIVKMTGDGMLGTFDGPGRAIHCATALGDALRPLGLQIRAGLHTGEVEMRGNDIAGIGVHIAARVCECAEPAELLVTAAVPMLVAGSGIEFSERGEHELKGVPGSWQLYAVEG